MVDGSPRADTLAALVGLDVSGLDLRLLRSPKGRASQMNAGAAEAGGELLFFLHADTRFPPDGLQAAGAMCREHPDIQAAAFRLRLDATRPFIRLCQWIGNLRNSLTRTPYGDQIQFFRAEVFRRLGGYADIPLMEDVEIMRRLRRSGGRIRILPQAALTSARRFEEEGPLRVGLRNSLVRLLYGLGFPAEKLARFYNTGRKADE